MTNQWREEFYKVCKQTKSYKKVEHLYLKRYFPKIQNKKEEQCPTVLWEKMCNVTKTTSVFGSLASWFLKAAIFQKLLSFPFNLQRNEPKHLLSPIWLPLLLNIFKACRAYDLKVRLKKKKYLKIYLVNYLNYHNVFRKLLA